MWCYLQKMQYNFFSSNEYTKLSMLYYSKNA